MSQAYNATRAAGVDPVDTASPTEEALELLKIAAADLVMTDGRFDPCLRAVGMRSQGRWGTDGPLLIHPPLATLTLRCIQGVEEALDSGRSMHRKISIGKLRKFRFGDSGGSFSRNPELATACAVLELAASSAPSVSWPQLDAQILRICLSSCLTRIRPGDRVRFEFRPTEELVQPVHGRPGSAIGRVSRGIDGRPRVGSSIEDVVVTQMLRGECVRAHAGLGGPDDLLRSTLIANDATYDALTEPSDQRFSGVADAARAEGLPLPDKPFHRFWEPLRDHDGGSGHTGRAERLNAQLKEQFFGARSGIAAV